MSILITGAAGRTSGYVLRALLTAPSQPDLTPQKPIRLLVRSQSSVDSLISEFPQLSDHEFVIADYLETSGLRKALDGVDVMFHNGPTFHSQETAMGIALIDAAVDVGVKHFVFCSVFHPLLTKLINHKAKLGVEEYLIESGLDFTILQPTSFMQNSSISSTIKSGHLPCVSNPSVLQGFVDLYDLAEVARNIILDPTPHNRASYQIVGQNCSLEDVAAEIGIRCNGGTTKIECVQVPREKALEQFASEGKALGTYGREGLERMLFYYDHRGIPGNSNVLRWLLGREPTQWSALVQREV